MTSASLLQFAEDDPAAIRAELLAGLLAAPAATISPKYLYDTLGSRLFAAITELPEYYPTRTEAAIFAEYQDSMAAVLAPVATLLDLGAGNCAKAASLFAALRDTTVRWAGGERRFAALCRVRAHAHRGLVQMAPRRFRRAARSCGLFIAALLVRRARLVCGLRRLCLIGCCGQRCRRSGSAARARVGCGVLTDMVSAQGALATWRACFPSAPVFVAQAHRPSKKRTASSSSGKL